MRLNAPELENAIRRSVLTEMRADKSLWKDYKRHRQRWLGRKLNASNKGALLFAFIWMGGIAAGRAQGPSLALLMLALYATATTLFRGSNFTINVLRGFDRVVLLHLPMSDQDFLKYEWEQFAWSWCGAFSLFLMTYSIVVLPSGPVFVHVLQVFLIALLQSLCGVSAALWLLAWPKKLKVMPYALLLYGLAFLSLWFSVWFPETAVSFLWSAILLVPQGWLTHASSAMLGLSPRSELAFFIPVSLAVLSAMVAFPLARKRLSAALHMQTANQDLELPTEEDQVFAEEPAVGKVSLEPSRAIAAEDVLRSATWEGRGWIEATVARFFTQRDRLVSEFLLAGRMGAWSTRWRKAGWVTAAGVLITLFAPLPPWFFFVPAVIAGFLAAPILGGAWLGFRGAAVYGLAMPVYALMPVSYGEISRVMFKANIVRVLAWVPLALVYAVALGIRLEGNAWNGFFIGAEMVVLVLVLQPLIVAGHFSAGTNDTKQLNRHTILLCFVGLPLLILLLVGMFGLFVPDSFAWRFLSLLGISVCSLSAWAGYKRLFNRGRVDLLAASSGSR